MFMNIRKRFGSHPLKILKLMITLLTMTVSHSLFAVSLPELFNQKPVIIFGNAKTSVDYKVVIPSGGSKELSLSMNYRSGSADLIFSQTPSFRKPVYCPYIKSRKQRIQQCNLENLSEGTYYVRVNGEKDSFYGSLLAVYSGELGITELEAGIWYTPSGVSGGNYDYTITLPDTAREFVLEFKPDGNTADAELLFTPLPRVGGVPTPFIACPLPGNTYECAYSQLGAGTYDVRIKANANFTSPKLLVRYALPMYLNQTMVVNAGHQNARPDFYYLPAGDEENAVATLTGDVGNVEMTFHNGVDKNDFSVVCDTQQLSPTEKVCETSGNMWTFGYYYVALKGLNDFDELELSLTAD